MIFKVQHMSGMQRIKLKHMQFLDRAKEIWALKFV